MVDPVIVGAMRVKNEARWIRRSIESILPICSRVIVLDDHSTDQTAVIATSTGQNVIVMDSPFTGLDEVRDKNYLLGACLQAKADWIIMIDGDEALVPGDAERLLALFRSMAKYSGAARALAFNVLYLWDRDDQIRVDGVYRSMSRVSAFRAGTERFQPTGGVNFHCGNCPQGLGPRSHAGVSLLHFGYMDSADRIRKYEWYRANDSGNQAEDEYRHIVVGDLFPAESRFRHGGPLDLAPLR